MPPRPTMESTSKLPSVCRMVIAMNFYLCCALSRLRFAVRHYSGAIPPETFFDATNFLEATALTAAGLPYKPFAHEHLQQRLITDALAFSDLAGLSDVGFGQTNSNLHTIFFIQRCNET